jgi:hypothetical protein
MSTASSTSSGISRFYSHEDWTEENIIFVKSLIENNTITTCKQLRQIIGNQSKKLKRDNGRLEPIYLFEILLMQVKNYDKDESKDEINQFFESESGFLKKFFKGSDLILSNSVTTKIKRLFTELDELPIKPDELALLERFEVAEPKFIERSLGKKKSEPTHYKQDDNTRNSLATNINVYINKNSDFLDYKKKLIAYFKGKAKYNHFVRLYQTKYPDFDKEQAGIYFIEELRRAIYLIETENELFNLLIERNPSERDLMSVTPLGDRTAQQQVENHQITENIYKSLYDIISSYLTGLDELIMKAKYYQKYLKYKAKYIALKSKLHM